MDPMGMVMPQTCVVGPAEIGTIYFCRLNSSFPRSLKHSGGTGKVPILTCD